jgi:hypothetical protein
VWNIHIYGAGGAELHPPDIIFTDKWDEPPVDKYYPAGDYYLSFADTGFLLDKGDSFQLELKGGANREDFTERAVWKSENASVATVNKGLVTGLKAGKVNIVCEIPTDTGGKATLKCEITVLGAADDPFDWYDPNPYIPEDQYDWFDEDKYDELNGGGTGTGKENTGNTGGKNTTVKPTIKKPAKVWGVGSKVSKKKKLTIKWTKLTAKVAGYQIQYREKGKSKWKTKTVSASKSKLALKKLKKGKRYQLRVRAYIVSSGVKYYGSWSNLKTSKKIRK